MNSSTFLTANAICFHVTGEIKESISTRSDSISCFPVQAYCKSASVVDLEKWVLKATTCSGWEVGGMVLASVNPQSM